MKKFDNLKKFDDLKMMRTEVVRAQEVRKLIHILS